MAEEMIMQRINNFASDVAKVVYHAPLVAAVSTLDHFRVPSRYFSFFRERDESNCLVYEEGIWSVFFSEKLCRNGERRTEDIVVACKYLLSDIAETEEEERRMISFFEKELSNTRGNEVPSRDLYDVLKENLKKFSFVASL